MTDRHPPLLVAVDVETTGLSSSRDRLVEVAAVRFRPDGEVLGRYSSLVRPDRPIPPGATAIHGIADATVAEAPEPARVLRELADFVGSEIATTLVGHNVAFDKGFLVAAHARAGVAMPPAFFNPACTLALARRRWPGLPSYRLGDLAARRGFPAEGLHRAAADADLAMRLWLDLSGTGVI